MKEAVNFSNNFTAFPINRPAASLAHRQLLFNKL
jgi:hypothetical protein